MQAREQLLGLTDRGTLAFNQAADVVIFDPQTITDRADYKNPAQLSVGIDSVLVNGKIAFNNKQSVSLNGQVIRR